MCIKEVAYEKYQWHWLMSHDYSINDLSDSASDWFNMRLSDPNNDDPFSDYVFDQGINGMLWACFDEFVNCEYQDADFMRGLLSEPEYVEYCNDIEAELKLRVVYVVQSEASYDGVRNFSNHGICREKERAKAILKEVVENSEYFEEAENPVIEESYADTNNQDEFGGDWQKISIEEMTLL